MSQLKCDKCGWWLGNSPEEHECPPHIRNKPTPKAERDNDVRWDEDDDGATASLKAKRVVTLDDLIEVCDIDLTEWYIERHVINKWEVGAKHPETGEIAVEPLFQVKAWLRPTEKFNTIIKEIEHARDMMIRSSPTFSGKEPTYNVDNEILAEVSMPDTHFGMYAWEEETGDRNHDIVKAREGYMDSIATLVNRSGKGIAKFLFVIGNDGLHADKPGMDGKGGATTRGTHQDTDTRISKVFRTKHETVIEAILHMASVAPVDVLVVPGNHDFYSSFYMGEVVRTYFKDHPSVTVNNSPMSRKYYQYGVNLIGFTHGDKEKPDNLPLIMAQSQKEAWANSVYREWHVGHLHQKRRGLTFDTEEYSGVRVRWMPSIVPLDAWHAQKGYIHQASAESLLWHPQEGNVGSAIVNLGVTV